MATKYEPVPLPANKTFGYRRSSFVPLEAITQTLAGVVEIREARREGCKETISRYMLRVTGRDGETRECRLTKPGGAAGYWVAVLPAGDIPGRAPADLCDCEGFLATGDCKHAQALAAHLAAGQLG